MVAPRLVTEGSVSWGLKGECEEVEGCNSLTKDI